MFKKNTAVTGFGIGNFINATTGATVTTGVPTCKRTLDGTAGACANAAAYDATGLTWKIDLAAGDLNGDIVALAFTLTDCLPINYTIRTSTSLVSDVATTLGTPAGASVSADILTIDNLVDDLETRLGTPSNLGSGATVAANLVDIEAQTDDIGAAGAGLAAIPNSAGTTTLLGRVLGTLDTGTHKPQSGDAYADTQTILARLGAWTGTGIDTVLGAFKALLSKAASAPSDIGGTFDPATDSTEALADATAGSVTVNATVAISATEAAEVATGALALRTFYTFRQTILSTSTDDLTAAELILAVKQSVRDADAGALLLLSTSGGLTVLAQEAYTTPAHGALTVAGSAGAWEITADVTAAAVGLLDAYAGTWPAECKAQRLGDDLPVWSGTAVISRGVVRDTA